MVEVVVRADRAVGLGRRIPSVLYVSSGGARSRTHGRHCPDGIRFIRKHRSAIGHKRADKARESIPGGDRLPLPSGWPSHVKPSLLAQRCPSRRDLPLLWRRRNGEGIISALPASSMYRASRLDFFVNHFSPGRVYTIEYMVAALVEPLLHEKEP